MAQPGNQNAVGPHKGMAGNQNATKHGLRAKRDLNRPMLGSLPPGASYVRREVGRWGRLLTAAVLDTTGVLGLYESSLVNSAMRHEAIALLACRWLRKEGEHLEVSARLGLLKQIQAATDARDKALKALGLQASRELSPLDALAALPPWDAETEPTQGGSDAEQAKTCGEVLPADACDTSQAGTGTVQGGSQTGTEAGE